MKKQFAFIFFIILFPFFSTGQLSGIYTVGGVSPDFVTIKDAVNSLNSLGVSGPVVFNIRSGLYDENIPEIFVVSSTAANTITFQSELLDSSTVTITNSIIWGYETLELSRGFFILNQLTLTNSNSNVIILSSNVEINCCQVRGIGNSINGSGATIAVRNSHLEKNAYLNGMASSVIEDCEVFGNLSMDSDSSRCYRNHIYTIHGHAYFWGYSDVEDNYFSGTVECINSNFSLFKNNIVDTGQAPIWFRADGNYVKAINNKFYIQAGFTGDNCTVNGNHFFGICGITGNYTSVTNNFFDSIAGTDYFATHIYFGFNNFSLDSGDHFENYGLYNVIENNNMPREYFGHIYVDVSIRNNNYQSGYCFFDSHPYHSNPLYLSSTDLHSTNPQLIGKGLTNSLFPYDIDSILRQAPPSIGANEICLSEDSVNIFCRDSIVLSLCNLPDSGSFTWSPSTNLNDSHIARPTVSTTVSRWYVVRDTAYGFTDSVFVNIIPFQVDAGNDDAILCGGFTQLLTTYNASASYQWMPIDSLLTPTYFFTKANPSVTTTYVVTAVVPGCGTSYDSVTVFVNPLPASNFYLDSVNFNYYSFLNASFCADTYYWEFGDSTAGSTDENPAHIFSDSGWYLVTLIACNSFGCDTFQGYVYIDSIFFLNVMNFEIHTDDFNVFPNPTSGSFKISSFERTPIEKIEVFNFFGELILLEEFKLSSISNREINLSVFPEGVYQLKITTSKQVEDKKVVLVR
ncbi:MAG: T9SS type A sorting domain-containing protein [Bacteroidota bacterium]